MLKEILGYDKPFHCSPIGFNPANYGEVEKAASLEEHLKVSIPSGRVVVGYAG